MTHQLTEDNNVFKNPDGSKRAAHIKKEYVPMLLKAIQSLLPGVALLSDIGSAGYKLESGDMDVFIDQQEVMDLFGVTTPEAAKKALSVYIQTKGLETKIIGRNVHVLAPLPNGQFGQLDLMIISDAADVAPFHQHGPRDSYADPDFKGGHIFILINSIGKFLGVKFDAFAGTLLDRQTNDIIARGRDQVAKFLLGPNAKTDDLNSVKSIMAALATDPDKDAKLAQARADAEKGLINLFETVESIGTPQWFRRVTNILVR